MKARKSIGVFIIILSAVMMTIVQLNAQPKEQLAEKLRPCILQASKVKTDAQTLMGLADERHAEKFVPQQVSDLQKKMEDLKIVHDAFLNILDDSRKKLYGDTIARLNDMYDSMNTHMLDLKQLVKKPQLDRNAIFAHAQSIQKTAGEWQMEYRGIAQALGIKLERS
jgi:hypothetical protein